MIHYSWVFFNYEFYDLNLKIFSFFTSDCTQDAKIFNIAKIVMSKLLVMLKMKDVSPI